MFLHQQKIGGTQPSPSVPQLIANQMAQQSQLMAQQQAQLLA